jgi:hypothetical protein
MVAEMLDAGAAPLAAAALLAAGLLPPMLLGAALDAAALVVAAALLLADPLAVLLACGDFALLQAATSAPAATMVTTCLACVARARPAIETKFLDPALRAAAIS